MTSGRRGPFGGTAPALLLAATVLLPSGLLPAAAAAGPPSPAGPLYRLTRVAADPAGGGDAALAPDGRSFVTSSRRSGNWDLWLHDLATGAWRQLTDDPAEDFEAQWSPRGDRLVFTSTRHGSKDVFVLRLADGALTRLTAGDDDEEYPRFSADGRQVVYTAGPWGRNRYFVIAAGGGTPRAVSRPGLAGACSFDPGGASLLCHRYDLGHGDLLRVDLATGAETRLTDGDAWDYKPTASPDGRWIAFSRGHEGPSGVWLMPAAGGVPRRLTDGGSGGSDRWPVWSGDGRAVFFHRALSRGTGVHLLDRASGAVRRLVGPEERPLQASLHPAGRLLAYCRQRRQGGHAVRILDLETGARRDLPVPAEAAAPAEACWPRFLPDGERLAFGLRRGGRWEIATAGADGSGLRVWTAGEPALRGLDGPIDAAPDGSALVFQGDTEPFAADLYRLSLTDGSLVNLTRDAWFDEAPAFTADGRGVLFMSTRGGGWTWALYRLGLDDGTVARLAGPDYEEKNYPRAGPGGAVVWTRRDGDGSEHLVELPAAAGPDPPAPRELPAGGRWPSYSADGRSVLFSTVEETVEFWLAENPFGPGSPLAGSPLAAEPAAVAPLPQPLATSGGGASAAVPVGRGASSPIDLFHR